MTYGGITYGRGGPLPGSPPLPRPGGPPLTRPGGPPLPLIGGIPLPMPGGPGLGVICCYGAGDGYLSTTFLSSFAGGFSGI